MRLIWIDVDRGIGLGWIAAQEYRKEQRDTHPRCDRDKAQPAAGTRRFDKWNDLPACHLGSLELKHEEMLKALSTFRRDFTRIETFSGYRKAKQHARQGGMKRKISLALLILAGLALATAPAVAQKAETEEPTKSKPTVPSRGDYPDAGQAFGMVWHYTNFDDEPDLSFMVPETDNQLWRMRCEKLDNGSVRIANLIIATPREMVAGDQFGVTIRVDDRPAIGVLARMLPAKIEGDDYSMPQFYLPNSHALLPALAKGDRAYVNLNGNKFSIDLEGSGKALISFLRACR